MDWLYSYRYSSTYNGIELYQYDGPEKIAAYEIPKEINGKMPYSYMRYFAAAFAMFVKST